MADVIRTIRFRFWLWLIRLIGVMVPRRLRANWKQEWEAELRYRELLLTDWDKLNWKTKIDLVRRSLGAFWDALLLQPQRLEDEMFQDLRFGARMLLKHKGFTLIALLTLALGIAANTTIFSAMESVILHPFSFPNQPRLVAIHERKLDAGINRTGVSPGSLRGQPNRTEQENVTQLVRALRQESPALDAGLPFVGTTTLSEAIRERISTKRFITVMLGLFALLALVMATVGLYAVMSFAVAQRTHEIGIRVALGARTRDVFDIVIRQGLRLVSLGIIIGLVGAFAATRLLSQMLYGLTASDPITYAMVAGLLLTTALVACIVPARRATKVDPMIALRHE